MRPIREEIVHDLRSGGLCGRGCVDRRLCNRFMAGREMGDGGGLSPEHHSNIPVLIEHLDESDVPQAKRFLDVKLRGLGV